MLAIVIPYYKIDFFEQTLESLSNQTNKNFTVYIGDDASPQNCLSLLEQFENRFNFKYRRFDTNFGSNSLVNQWNRCVNLIENENWVTILGDDDVLSENFVAQFYEKKHIFEREYSVIRYGVVKIDNEGNKISSIYSYSTIESSKNILFKNKRSSLSEYVFKLSEIRNIGFKDLPLAWWSDVLAVLEFSNFGNVFSINEAIVSVRISERSISGNRNHEEEKERAYFMFLSYLLSNKKDNFNDLEFDILLQKISKRYLNNRKKLSIFFEISILYLKNNKFQKYSEFIMIIIKSFFK